jgi:hypothetical protein
MRRKLLKKVSFNSPSKALGPTEGLSFFQEFDHAYEWLTGMAFFATVTCSTVSVPSLRFPVIVAVFGSSGVPHGNPLVSVLAIFANRALYLGF